MKSHAGIFVIPPWFEDHILGDYSFEAQVDVPSVFSSEEILVEAGNELGTSPSAYVRVDAYWTHVVR